MSTIDTFSLSSSGRVARLLIVDDNEINRLLLERIFAREGHHVTVAADGHEALEQLKRDAFDLVILDIMMPVMDGLTALERIRSKRDTASLPVILVSAMSDTSDIVRGLELGANDYITKPVDMAVALARVRTQLALKFLIDEREEAIHRLEASQTMREQFFRIASHDLKQPLTSLKTANILLRELVDAQNERAQSVLDTMKLTINTMTEVVTDFLDTAAVQSGALDMNIQPLRAHELVQTVLVQHHPAAYEKGIHIQVSDIHGTLLGDRARLVQVLGNIVSNAIKYSPSGETIHVWAVQERDTFRIFVADNGTGIPPNEQIKLFQPFGKLSNQPTAGESSHGLGLWIASHLVHLQNGDIGVESPPGGGSTFWISLPLADGDT
jgi:two-component system, sensor histidine kinase and response regulator